MRIPRYIIDNLPARVRIPFLHWTEYMEKNLSFNLADSEIHTKSHSERVLLYALLIGEKMAENTKTDLCALAHAAIFHDTRRLDDGLDTGHGERAASYYMKYCELNKDITFMNVASLIMKRNYILFTPNVRFLFERAKLLLFRCKHQILWLN